MREDCFGNPQTESYFVYHLTAVDLERPHGYFGRDVSKDANPRNKVLEHVRDAKKFRDSYEKDKESVTSRKRREILSRWDHPVHGEEKRKGMRLEMLECFSDAGECKAREKDLIAEHKEKWGDDCWNDRPGELVYEEPSDSTKVLEVRGKEMRYKNLDDIQRQLEVSGVKRAMKRYPNTEDGLVKACETALENSETQGKMFAIEGSVDRPFRLKELGEGGSHEDLNPHGVPIASLGKRVGKYPKKDIGYQLNQWKRQVIRLLPLDFVAPPPDRKEHEVAHTLPDGRILRARGRTVDFHRQASEWGDVCYNGGPVRGLTSFQSMANRDDNRYTVEQSLGLTPPPRWERVFEMAGREGWEFVPPLERGDWLSEHPALEPEKWVCPEYGKVFRGKGAFVGYVRENSRGTLDERTVTRALENGVSLAEILSSRGIYPEASED